MGNLVTSKESNLCLRHTQGRFSGWRRMDRQGTSSFLSEEASDGSTGTGPPAVAVCRGERYLLTATELEMLGQASRNGDSKTREFTFSHRSTDLGSSGPPTTQPPTGSLCSCSRWSPTTEESLP
jgi:hypothetical protein